MGYKVDYEERMVQAKEAFELTGVSQVSQRDWRIRGLIEDPGGEGRARYPLFTICKMKVLSLMSEAGINLNLTKTLAESVSLCVMQNLLQHRNVLKIEGLGEVEDQLFDELTELAVSWYAVPDVRNWTFKDLLFDKISIKGSMIDLTNNVYFLNLFPETGERGEKVTPFTRENFAEYVLCGELGDGIILSGKSAADKIAKEVKKPLATMIFKRDDDGSE